MGLGHNHRRTLDRCRKHGFTARFVPFREYLERSRDVYNQTMDRVKAKDTYYFDEAYFPRTQRAAGGALLYRRSWRPTCSGMSVL